MRMVWAFLILWLGLIVEATVFQIPPINAIQPDFVLVILILVALMRGPNAAVLFAIAIGLIQDICYGSFIGLNAFSYGLMAYFSAAIFGQFMQRNLAVTFFTTLGLTFVHLWVTYGLTRLFEVTADPPSYVLSQVLVSMIVNGILALMLYPAITRILAPVRRSRYDTTSKTES